MPDPPKTSPNDDPAPRFLGRLLPHQHDGVRWLAQREAESSSRGGILADEMGLGKTIQMLAHMCRFSKKTLIVVPKSLVGQWLEQLSIFTTLQHVHLRLALGSINDVRRAARTTDVCLATYEFLNSFDFQGATFERIVLDEAHRIRNSRSKTHQRVASFPCSVRWAITGTPLLSRKRDFASLVSWISPGANVPSSVIMLRRTFDDLGSERVKLPPCEFINHVVELSPHEKAVYNGLVAAGKRATDEDHVLRTLFKLQQCLVSLAFVDEPCIGPGTKVLRLIDLATNKAIRRLLVFTHHRNELDVAAMACEHAGCIVVSMDGQTPLADRGSITSWFNDTNTNDERRALVTNLNVGGVGLNLQATDTIIFLSPDWTPSLEMQAVARAHRIGCSHKVTVHRILAKGTVDEHVSRMQTKKLGEVAALFEDDRVQRRFGGKLMDPTNVQSILSPISD